MKAKVSSSRGASCEGRKGVKFPHKKNGKRKNYDRRTSSNALTATRGHPSIPDT
jgi:hypothetical protein